MKGHKPIYQDLENEIIRLKLELKIRDEMINTSPNPWFVKNKDFKYINCNNAFADYLGIPKSKIINATVYDISPKELADKYHAADCELRDQLGKQQYESKVKYADGTLHDIVFNKACLIDEENEFSGIVGVLLDITKRKQVEESLVENKSLLAKSESISNQGSWKWSIVDDKWSFSDNWLNIHGINDSGISQKELMKIAHPDDASKIEKAMSDALNYNLPYSLEHRIIRKDNGEVRIIKALGEVHFGENGNPEFMIGVAQDITERKQAEIELTKAKEKAEENEQKYRALYENAPLPYQSLNEDGSFKDVNPAWLSTLGYTREEVIGKFYKDFLHPDWQSHFNKNFPAFKKRGYVSDVQFKIRHKKGHYIDISFEGCIGYHPDGSFKQTYCVFQDITYKKQVENALVDAKEKAEESEAKFRELFSNVNDAVFMYNPDTFEILEANEATSELYGYGYDELIGMSCLKFSAEIEKSKSVAKLIKNEKKVTVKLRHHKKKDGSDVFVELSNYNISVNGKNIIYSVCHDITGIKKTEQELLKNQYYLIKAQEMGNIGTWEIDLLSNRLVWTDETYKIFGIPTGTLMTYELFLNCIHPEDRDYVAERWNEALKNKSYDIEHRILVQGEIKWLREKSEFEYDSEGNAIRAIGFAQDITNRKNSEQELSISEQKYRNITENLPGIVLRYKLNTDGSDELLYISKEVEDIYELSLEDALKNNNLIWDRVHKDDLDAFLSSVEESAKNLSYWKFEHRIQLPDSRIKWVYMSGVPVQQEDGSVIWDSIGLDITEQKKTELELIKAKEEVEESEELYKLLAENASDVVWIIDFETGNMKYVSPSVKMQRGYSQKEVMTQDFIDYLTPDSYEYLTSKVSERIELFKQGIREYFNDELEQICKDGSTIWTEVKARYIKNRKTGKIEIIGVTRDISKQKKYQNNLITAKEKAEASEEKFKLLNSLTSEMLLLQDMESIYKFIAGNLQKLHPNTIVLNVSIDESIQQSRLEVISGLDNSLLAKVIKISGFNPIGKTYRLTDIHNNYFRSGDFIEFEGGLAEFSASEFPAVAASAIEKLIGLHKIYTIGINKDDGLLAAIHFFTFNKQIITDGNFIEVFAKQAGLVLQKKIDEKALKIAKEKAEESEKQLKLIADNFVNGMIYQVAMLDENRRKFNYISENVNELYGCTVEQAKENADLIYGKLHPDDINGLIEKEKDALKTMSVFETEARAIKPNGDIRWAYYISKPRIINGIVCWDGIEIDITERKQMELELIIAKEKAEENEHRLKLATSSGELGIWDWNVKENKMVWDECMFKLYGIEKSTLVNTVDAWVNGLHPEDKDRAIAESNEALAGSKEFDTTFRVLHPDGTVKYLKADAVVIRDNNKKAIRMIGINKDVTESILAEQSLKTSETQLKELNATKDKLFSIIAHDLRSPFNNILGYSELLSENVEDFNIEQTKKYSGIINSTAKKTLDLLDNLLTWAKSQRGTLSIRTEKIMLSKVILEVIQLKKLLAKSKNITLNYNSSDEFIVYSDENMLKLVLRNLISNAIKFTKAGGIINISVISAQNHVEISVSDNGVGMSEETSKKLFDISTNTTSPGTANEKGSGLGLVLCKEFVEKLGGKIWVESIVGKGSDFKFTLPLNKSE